MISSRMVYDQKDIAALVRALHLHRRPLRVLNGLSRLCFLFSGGLLLLVGGAGLLGTVTALFRGEGVYPMTLAVELLFLQAGVSLCLGRGGRLTAWLTWRRYPEKGKEVAYDFYEDRFEEHTEHSDHRFDYAVVADVLEERERFYLFVGSAAHVLKKSDMAGDGPADFAAFLTEKCGKPPAVIQSCPGK